VDLLRAIGDNGWWVTAILYFPDVDGSMRLVDKCFRDGNFLVASGFGTLRLARGRQRHVMGDRADRDES
jgi:hypothetical protein